MTHCTRFSLLATVAMVAGLCAAPALAQAAYPNRPIRVIVPFAAGSTTDIIARAISDKMSLSMGQQLVVDNRGGASGTIGQGLVANADADADADGYTIMVHSSSHTVSRSAFDRAPPKTQPARFNALRAS